MFLKMHVEDADRGISVFIAAPWGAAELISDADSKLPESLYWLV